MKKLYNVIDAGFALPVASKLIQGGENYISYRDVCFYNDMLVVKPVNFYNKRAFLDYRIERIASYAKSCADTEFYLYYIETDKDIDFETGEKSGVYEYLSEALSQLGLGFNRLETSCFADYRRNFLGTDHHWNGAGAYTAYLDICQMLGCEALPSLGLHTVQGQYLGTRAAGIEGIEAESFSVNVFDYPEMDFTINGISSDDYGHQQQFIQDSIESISYGNVFGPDCKEIIIDTGLDGEKLLVMGDSYDNAILKALASGFSKTYSIDLRAHEADSFDLCSYVEEHDIDKVLFIGGIDYFSSILY